MFYDTHVHFEHLDGAAGIAALLERARAAGVGRLLAVGANAKLNASAIEAARRFPGTIRAAVGLDRDHARNLTTPEQVDAACCEVRETILRCLAEGVDIAALGEIGLDFHYSPESAGAQEALFRAQLRLARELRLPVIIHSREADRETLSALSEHAAACVDPARVGVLHCFTGDRTFAEALLGLGFYISFSGIVTFRNADPLRAVASTVPAERLLIETDTPWLAPVPCRGQPNEPAFVAHVAECLARVRGATLNELADCTSRNAGRLFGG